MPGVPGLIVQEILVLNEKGVPPEGYSLLTKTADTDQKAWRKKQLCYKLVSRKNAQAAVTDIILCNRLKKAPEGFTLAGEINGITVCYKMGNVQDTESTENSHNLPAPKVPTSFSSTVYPDLDKDDHDYEILNPGYVPARPAPRPPVPASTGGSLPHMLTSTYNALEGVPFIINPRFMPSSNGNAVSIAGLGDRHIFISQLFQCQVPIIKARTMQQLMKDYDYSFTVERQ